MNRDYLLSIITVTYNAELEIQKTIDSLLSQMNSFNFNIEYLIQDGLSTDDTLKMIYRYYEKMKYCNIDCSILSEKDSGIYDAMNRGINRACGKWVCLLNAGDIFTNDTSLKEIYAYLDNSNADILYSDYYRVNKYHTRKVCIPELNNIKKTMIFCHQALFIRKDVYRKELYDCKYRLAADYDLLLRLFIKGYHFEKINNALINYDTEGISGKNMLSTYKEIYSIRKNNGVVLNYFSERVKYSLGIIKRLILINIPQDIRWKIYKIIKG